VQHAVATRAAMQADSIAYHPAPVKRPAGNRPHAQLPLGVQALSGEKHVWAELHLGGCAGEHQVRGYV
jgi:hypothetical protein